MWREEQRSAVFSEWLVQRGNRIGDTRPRHWNWQTRQVLNLNSSSDKFTICTTSKRNRKAQCGRHTSCFILKTPNKMKVSTALKARSHQHLKWKVNSMNGFIHKVNPQESCRAATKNVTAKKCKKNLFWWSNNFFFLCKHAKDSQLFHPGTDEKETSSVGQCDWLVLVC